MPLIWKVSCASSVTPHSIVSRPVEPVMSWRTLPCHWRPTRAWPCMSSRRASCGSAYQLLPSPRRLLMGYKQHEADVRLGRNDAEGEKLRARCRADSLHQLGEDGLRLVLLIGRHGAPQPVVNTVEQMQHVQALRWNEGLDRRLRRGGGGG